MVTKKYRLKANLAQAFGLTCHLFYPTPPEEIDRIYYYVDDIPGDGRGES